MLIPYLIVKYGKISPSQLIDLEHNTRTMQYEPQNPIKKNFNQVEDLIKYGELDISQYIQIQTTNTAYRNSRTQLKPGTE